MKLYYVADSYVDYLRRYDPMVPDNKNKTRPYVGIVLTVNEINYFAPLTSPKPKHLKMKNGIDFRKIGNGRYGAINLNNMIPIVDEALTLIDIDSEKDVKYRRLLQNQFEAISFDESGIKKSAEALRKLVLKNDDELPDALLKIKSRCCNLCVLEKCYLNYKK